MVWKKRVKWEGVGWPCRGDLRKDVGLNFSTLQTAESRKF